MTTLEQLQIDLKNAMRLEDTIRNYINAWRRELSKVSRDRAKTQRAIQTMLAERKKDSQ